MSRNIISFDGAVLFRIIFQLVSLVVCIGIFLLLVYLLILLMRLSRKGLEALDLWIGKNKASHPASKIPSHNFITPLNHVKFHAKKLFSNAGEILDGSIAYLEPTGGGPIEVHTHEHNHLFIVIDGEAKVLLDDKEIIIKKDESFLVQGNIPHSVWNNINVTTIMVGLSIK